MSNSVHFEVELSEKQLNDMVHILRSYMKQQYDETTKKSILPSDERIEKFNAAAATFAQFQDAYDDYVSDEFTAEEEDDDIS